MGVGRLGVKVSQHQPSPVVRILDEPQFEPTRCALECRGKASKGRD